MIGYVKIDRKRLKDWEESEVKRIKASEDLSTSCWYNSLWKDYFYERQSLFKGAQPLIEKSRYSNFDTINNNVPEFESLVDSLEDEGQRLNAYYADETAVIAGYQDHKYILPAELAEVELLRDYSAMTTGELSLLGDSQMSEAMLPADMNGCSIKSVESQLDEQKKQIADAEEKCKQAIEAIREEAMRKEQELRALLERETEKLNAVKEDLENKLYVLDTQIYGIRCYLGEVVDFKQIRSGSPATADTPVVIFQKIRFLDEEMGKYLSLYDFGEYSNDKETLIGALKARDDLRDVFCPSDRCITVLRNSRTGKIVKASDKVANMLEKYEYLHGRQIAVIVRDGENLYIGWMDEDKVNISSEDVFLRPGVTSVSEVKDEEYGFGHRYWSEKERIETEKKMARLAMGERVSRYFLMSVLQGMVDRGGLINIPQKTKITEESELVKFSFAEGWLTDSTYGDFVDILNKSKDIEVKKGEILLTGMKVTRDDIHNYNNHFIAQYEAYSNSRGIGEKNRTHGANIPAFKLLPVNKVLKNMNVNVTFDLVKGIPEESNRRCWDGSKAYNVVKDPSGEILGTYTCKMNLDEDDFNAAGTLINLKKVIETKYSKRPLWYVDDKNEIDATWKGPVRFNYLPDMTKYGIPEIKDIEMLDSEYHTFISVPMETYNPKGARVNFEIMPDEYVRTTYLCTTWIKYVITTKHVGDFRIGGASMSYAETLKYLNRLMEHVKSREESEKQLLIEAGGEDYISSHTEWDRELCEWRIANQIPALTIRSAHKFLKESRGK